jgi:peptidoglycan hydrolase-like protein with peptidoglycan-binding domain
MKIKTLKNLFWPVIILLVFLSQVNFAEAFSGAGDGLSEETAFIITNCDQLQEMNGELESYYKLGNNIDCSATATWNANEDEWVDGVVGGTLINDPYVGVVNNGYLGFEPIGWDNASNLSGPGFTGTLDGQGYTISNLWIFRKNIQRSGLIGHANGATIKNINLANARIVGSSYTGSFLGFGTGVTLQNLTNSSGMVRAYISYYGGGIAGWIENSSTITNLSTLNGSVHGSGNVIGGLIGTMHNSTISSSTASTTVDGGEYIGGAFGSMFDSSASNMTVRGVVESNSADDLYSSGFSKIGRYTGGFAGYIQTSNVSDITVSGSVTAEDGYAGGFAGSIVASSNITDVAASGNVSANDLAGGFAGQIDSSNIEDSTARGNVETVGGNTGGFVGVSSCGSTYLRVAAYGSVSAGGNNTGGFVGSDGCEGPGSTFTEAAAHGDVTSTGSYIGGFMGSGSVSTFANAYAGGDVVGLDQVGGFVGYSSFNSIDKAYSRGLVVAGDGASSVGGFIGEENGSTISNSFYDNGTAGQLLDCGGSAECNGLTSLTTGNSKISSTYTNAGWDFEFTWQINSDNEGYPHFVWEELNALLPGSGTQGDPYRFTGCFTASQSGYYQLQNDINSASGQYCISIEADGVYINGGGYSINGDSEDTGYAVYSEGYDSVHISSINLDTFVDGIALFNVRGTSTITNVNIENISDDGMDLDGLSNLTISSSTITNAGDDGITIRAYYDSNDERIDNTNITIRDVVITDTGEFGLELDFITGLLVEDNQISDTGDDGISSFFIENAQILDNSLTNIDGDGMYIEGGTNVQISRNTINTTTADAIDIDEDGDPNTNFVITDNVLTDIDDVGLEIYDLTGATISGNTIEVSSTGLDVFRSENMTFTNNTITPIISSAFTIQPFVTNSTSVNIVDAEQSISTAYDNITYTLPFTFNFKGRNITSIVASTNGSIELLEDGESCLLCSSGGDYRNSLYTDVIFASYDEITTAGEGNYLAIFNQEDSSVVVEWRGSTIFDDNSAQNPIHFQVVLYPSGEVRWNFMQMDFVSSYNPMFTGAYDAGTGDLYRAGIDITEPSSYRADLSGGTSFVSTDFFDSITGIELDFVTDSTFIGNNIQAARWVDAEELENTSFNDSDSGNTYRLTNGDGAWTIFNLADTDGNGYAESGTDRPFSQATVGSAYWNGQGQDAYPRTMVTAQATPAPVAVAQRASFSGYSVPSQSPVGSGFVARPTGTPSTGTSSGTPANAVGSSVSTTRDLQRFLNTNGFPIAPSGPGSLNNETGVFGARTRQALIRFQRANGISPALGIFGPVTRAFINRLVSANTNGTINNSTSTVATFSTSTQATSTQGISTASNSLTSIRLDLSTGSTGENVKKLQEILIKSGFQIASGATGRFGQQTRNALIQYQRANNITPATGNFGPATRAHMKNTGVEGLWW